MKTKLSFLQLTVFLAFFLTKGALTAQENFLTDTSQLEVGQELKNGKKVKAIVYHFKERIQDVTLDPKGENIFITFRALSRNGKWLKNKGNISLYSADFSQLHWSKEIKFNQSNFRLNKGMILQRSSRGSFAFNKQDGKEIWSVKNSLFYLLEEENVGFGYHTTTDVRKDGILSGYNLKSGRKKWNRTIDPTYGWNEVLTLNDTTLLISADGLYALNPKTGKGWEHQLKTGSKDHTAAAIGTGLGVIAGALTGTYGIVSGANIVRPLASNVLLDSTELYFASKEKLSKLNTKGEVLWEVEQDKKETSKSNIFLSNDSLFLINYGYAYKERRKKQFGRAYMACYHAASGELLYKAYLSEDKSQFISDWKQKGSQFLFSFEEALLFFSSKRGKAIGQYQVDRTDYGKFLFFIDDNVFLKRDSSFVCLNSLSDEHYYLYTDQNTVLEIDASLIVINQYKGDELYVSYQKEGNQQLIFKDGESYVIDKQGKLLVKLNASKSAVLIDSVLYNKKENSLHLIDLSDVLESN